MKVRIKKSTTLKTPKSALRRGALLIAVALATAAFTVPTDLTDKRQGELLYMLDQDCGSCHGLTLKGGLGPALQPDRLIDRSAADLAEIILDGVPGTPMPPWRPLMSEQEALWLGQVLKAGDRVK